jgi:cytochrome c oxidase subunit II
MPGSILETHGPKATEISGLWWFMLALACVVIAVVFALLGAALVRQRRPPALDERGLVHLTPFARFGSNALVVVFGLTLPGIVLLGLLWTDIGTLAHIAQPPREPSLTVDVIGHQFWWEFQYRSENVTSPNELHIPTGQSVLLRITGNDVIHSFWVPQLMGKLDAIPFQTNTTWIQADQPGTYRGECAEFCGAQHAHMGFLVVADSPAQFAAWLDAQRAPAAAPADEASANGAQAFARAGCIECHAIRYGQAGVGGQIGPDLTHVGSRRSLAANTLDNNLGSLEGWIGNPQAIKPGNQMPVLPLDGDTLRALATYLESLK